MKIEFFRSSTGRSPIEDFIRRLSKPDRARFAEVIIDIQKYGFACPRVSFRQLRGKLWEVKFRTASGGYRVAYVMLQGEIMVWLHAFQKKTPKTPLDDLRLAEKRMMEVLRE